MTSETMERIEEMLREKNVRIHELEVEVRRLNGALAGSLAMIDNLADQLKRSDQLLATFEKEVN